MRKILIMGASSGIGLALAETLVSRGVKVGLAARHTHRLLELQKKYPDFVDYISVDVTHRDAVLKTQELIDKMGGLDLYIHVAGIGYDNPELDPELEVEMLRTNSEGFVRMLSFVYNYFKTSGRKGQIAAVTSVAGTNGIGQLSAYSSSKKCAQTYMVALQQLANEEGLEISFTDIRPGWIKTPLLKESQSYPMEMSLDYVVPRMLKAIIRKERVAYIDWRWGLLAKAWSMIPDGIWINMNIPISKPES